MEQKQQFVSLALSGHYTVTELCAEYGVSRKTGHKWVTRYRDGGSKNLEDRSRAPKRVTSRTPEAIERLIVGERQRHLTWGAKKIHRILMTKHGLLKPPVVSTVGEVLKRHGMIRAQRRRGAVFKAEQGKLTLPERCNHVLGVDFKGWFQTVDGERCDVLTVTDLHSRYLLKTEVLPQATVRWTQEAFRAMFRRYGLPEIIRVDNGAPFASMGPGGLSKLSVWWIGLGIAVEFSRPGCPQDNGCHERMHRTMKAECCKPASANLAAQQQRLYRWSKEFNEERPHESLGMRVPADVYHASARRLNERIKIRLYDLGVEVRRVSENGSIGMNGKTYYVGESFAGVDVAVEWDEQSELHLVRYANVKLGTLEDTFEARLRPTASAELQRRKPCKVERKNVSTKKV